VLALVRNYDPEAEGLDNSRQTVAAVISAVFERGNQIVNFL
jgi:hypothetical protein